MLIYSDGKESDFSLFVKEIVSEHAARELALPQEATDPTFEAQYGPCKQPFGILRLRVVEFLAQTYQVFGKDIH